MTQIWRIYNGYIPFMLVGLAVWAATGYVVYRVRVRRGQPRAAERTVGDFLLSAYILGLLVVTMGPSSGAERSVELMPGSSLMDFVHKPDITAPLVEVLLNIAMWIPLPMLVGYRFPKLGAWPLLWVAVVGATTLEVLQLILGIGRATSVDDVLAAALGAGIGLGLRALFRSGRGRRAGHDEVRGEGATASA
ncbi:VanZ family protein [Luteimicrobium subarcticum]|uniref:VanZ like protein n=1 Tax=Luteimicrobium subarcticum TaxID=620910 RepID=A0A2M8W1E0_9MICO|nr:VanZ family protein [Luteimicrobium subarcticum]PJI84742.1 VanZ like protein [Luteimicrobium subarcticum]